MIAGMRRWLVVLIVIASCKKGRDRGDDEAARAMALGAIADIKQAIATAKTRIGTPDEPQGMARCASVQHTRLELRDTPPSSIDCAMSSYRPPSWSPRSRSSSQTLNNVRA